MYATVSVTNEMFEHSKVFTPSLWGTYDRLRSRKYEMSWTAKFKPTEKSSCNNQHNFDSTSKWGLRIR